MKLDDFFVNLFIFYEIAIVFVAVTLLGKTEPSCSIYKALVVFLFIIICK